MLNDYPQQAENAGATKRKCSASKALTARKSSEKHIALMINHLYIVQGRSSPRQNLLTMTDGTSARLGYTFSLTDRKLLSIGEGTVNTMKDDTVSRAAVMEVMR